MIKNLCTFIFLFFFSSCFFGPLNDGSTGSEESLEEETNESTSDIYTGEYSATEVIGFEKSIQNRFDSSITEALEKLPDSNLAFIEYKALIAVESSFNQYAESPTRAKGLLQFTSIAIEDINLHPGKLGFYFDNPYDPEQSIFAGVRAFELLVQRLDNLYYNKKGGRPLPKEYKKILLTGYNAGIGTLVDALFILDHPSTSLAFDELILPLAGVSIEDTPIYMAIIDNASGNGVLVDGEIDYDLVEFRYDEISTYAYTILDLIPKEEEPL